MSCATRLIFHLVPAPSVWLTEVEAIRSQIAARFGSDSSYTYNVHCSLTSFFTLPTQLICAFCADFMQTLVDFSPTSTASSSPSSMGKPPSFDTSLSSSPVTIGAPLVTPDGCVILPVSASPRLHHVVRSFAREKGLNAKPLSHVSLAKNRPPAIAAAIADCYAPLAATAGAWDVVLLEQTEAGDFKEHLRMSLH